MPLVPTPKQCDPSVKKAIQILTQKLGLKSVPTFAGLTLSAGPLDLSGKLTVGSFGSPIDVTATRQYGFEIHYSGNDYNATAIRARAHAVTTDTSAQFQGGLFQAANNDDVSVGVLNGLVAEAIGKATTNAATITMMRGALIGAEWSAKDTVTDLRTLHVRTHTRDAATEGYVSGTGYGVYIENEAVGGNGQALDAGIYFKGTNLSAGNKAFTYGIDFTGATYGTADIKLSSGGNIDMNTGTLGSSSGNLTIKPSSTYKVIIQPTTDSTTFFQVLDADGGTPILNVDTTNERVGIGTNSPGSSLQVAGTVDGTPNSEGVHLGVLNNYASIELADNAGGLIDFGIGDGTDYRGRILYSHSSNVMQILTGGTSSNALIISSAGRFGIRTSPAVGLHIKDDIDVPMRIETTGIHAPGFDLWTPSGRVATFGIASVNGQFCTGSIANDFVLRADAAGDFIFSNAASTSFLFKIEEAGNVGIGVTSPQEKLAVTGNLALPKTAGNGIKVDTTTPTFGWADLLGDQFSRNTGGTKPTLTTYNGAIDAWQFSDGDEAYLTYHIPHDYVPSTDIHLHVHWSQNNAGATGGTIDFKYFAIYAKGHNQASGSTFTPAPITETFPSININDDNSGLSQYQHHITEVIISAASATAALFDRDDFEPDGVIELTLEMDANNLTGTPSDPFIHHVDIHYQTTGLIGTKQKAPDFYT